MGAKTDSYQVGLSVTATNNFTLVSDGAGGFKIARGNPGATTQDILTVNAAGEVTILQPEPWQVSAPTPTPASGAFGSAVGSLRYRKVGKTVFIKATVDITSIGTASGDVRLTLPYTAAAIGTNREWSLSGRESRQVGYGMLGWVPTGGSVVVMLPFSGSSLGNNHLLNVAGFYETDT